MILPGRVLAIMFLAGFNIGAATSNALPYPLRLALPIVGFVVLLGLFVWWLVGYRAAIRRTRF